jgi:hypothetical protein
VFLLRIPGPPSLLTRRVWGLQFPQANHVNKEDIVKYAVMSLALLFVFAGPGFGYDRTVIVEEAYQEG